MFTGIIENTATIVASQSVAGGRRLRLSGCPWSSQCKPGDSVAVNGVCLTVTRHTNDALEFDVIKETLEKTTLGDKRTGDIVNLERSIQPGGRFDGHFVQGHVDGTAVVERADSSPQEWVVWLRPESHLRPFMIPKGSVAIDGVSLTIAAVSDTSFSVALIPTTLERTTFSSLAQNDRVNIESDMIVRAVVHHLSCLSTGTGLTLDKLTNAGVL